MKGLQLRPVLLGFAGFFRARALALGLATVGAAACQQAKVATAEGMAGSSGIGARNGGAGGSLSPTTDGSAFDLAPGSGSSGGSDPNAAIPDGGACAEESKRAMQAPLDVLLVIDASSSMLAMTPGGGSKYTAVKTGLLQFVAAPGSAGLGMGVLFFPQPGPGTPCKTELDCGYINSGGNTYCQTLSACAKTVAPGATLAFCGGNRAIACPAGDTCVPLGRCTATLADCTNLGQPCAGGAAGDTCMAIGKLCEQSDGQVCDTAAYAKLAAPFADLPAPGTGLVTRAFSLRSPNGGTPLRPALDGAVAALAERMQARPGRKAILVLATDGSPQGCSANTVADVVKVIEAARTSPAALSTYVIGVATPNDMAERMVLGQLASAGGTGMPFVISDTEKLSERFLETLNQIRGQALPCDFGIPKSNAGPIDFGKVNVRVANGATQEDILYTGSADRCDPVKGGWYYDVPPATGTPTRIIVCEASCKKLKAATEATVDLRFGCATRTID